MGSLTSRPKLPPLQQPMIITAPQPAPTPTAKTPVTGDNGGDSNNQTDGAGSEEEKRRSAGLLDRSRGRLGTVLTGFRGLLGQSAGTGRKTLLGE